MIGAFDVENARAFRVTREAMTLIVPPIMLRSDSK